MQLFSNFLNSCKLFIFSRIVHFALFFIFTRFLRKKYCKLPCLSSVRMLVINNWSELDMDGRFLKIRGVGIFNLCQSSPLSLVRLFEVSQVCRSFAHKWDFYFRLLIYIGYQIISLLLVMLWTVVKIVGNPWFVLGFRIARDIWMIQCKHFANMNQIWW